MIPATRPPTNERRLATIIGTDIDTRQKVAISQQARQQGVYIIGNTGVGKSALLLNMLLSDIHQGLGVALIEPHGDLTKNVLSTIPQSRLKDVIYLDLSDSETGAVGLNLFQCDSPHNPTEVAKVASFVMHLFERVWSLGTHTPQLAQVLRNVTRALIENQTAGVAFSEIPLLLWDDTVRAKLVKNVTSPQTQLFWQQYNRKSPRDRDELISSTMNKVDAYLNEPMIAHIVSQSKTTINLRNIMDEGKILLVNLSPQIEEMSRLVGALLIGRLLMTAFSRSDTREENRRQFNLYVDEFQRFATSEFRTFIEEARKFRVSVTIAHQALSQILDEANRTSATGSGSLICFRVLGDDSKILARSFDATPKNPEIIGDAPVRAPIVDPISHLVRHGHHNPLVAKFTSFYLMPLETLVKKVSAYTHPFEFGCTLLWPTHVIEAERQLTEVLATCMREGRPDIFIPPFALFVLGGAADDGITQVFYSDIKHSIFTGAEFMGFYEAAKRFGRADFLENRKAVDELLKQYAKKRVWDDIFESRIVTPGPSFIKMLTILRQTMAILAKEPLLTDTGLYQPKYQQRTYADMEAQVANDLSQMPNFHAKVRLLTGEHTIRTHLAPPLSSERELQERIAVIKRRMLFLGYTKPYTEVEEELRLRQERLRKRPASDAPPPPHTNGKRGGRPKPPPAHT